MRVLTAILATILITGCTTMAVVPVAKESMTSVCIVRNSDVNVDDFVSVVQKRFAYHGIQTRLFDGAPPTGTCPYTLEYTADRWWDLAPYMVDATLMIKKGNEVVASGHYHLRGHGGLSMAKWEGTEAKLNPVIDDMLSAYPAISTATAAH
jgi:hypothetical protein